MRRLMIAGLMAMTAPLAAAAAPAVAQVYQPSGPGYGHYDGQRPARDDAVERRWVDAQARYRAEVQRYQMERDRYERARRGEEGYGYAPPPPPAGNYDNGYDQGGYSRAPVPDQDDERDENGYDASRYYRDGPNYSERTLSRDDRVYAGSDGRYYCRRSDGTTGLIVGGAAGGVLGNVIDGGHSRAVGTLLGGALGALVGKSVDQQNASVRCR